MQFDCLHYYALKLFRYLFFINCETYIDVMNFVAKIHNINIFKYLIYCIYDQESVNINLSSE